MLQMQVSAHFLFTSEWSHWLVRLTKALSYMHWQSCTLVGVTQHEQCKQVWRRLLPAAARIPLRCRRISEPHLHFQEWRWCRGRRSQPGTGSLPCFSSARPCRTRQTFMQELVSKQQEDRQKTGSKVRFFTQVPQKLERSFKMFD